MSLGARDKLFMERHGLTFQKSLGEGQFGKVVKAYSNHTRQNCAVKIINRKTAQKIYQNKFLSRELEIMKCLNHLNIIKTHCVFEQERKRSSKVFIVMELCVNGNLSEYEETNGPLSEELSRRFFVQLCAAVQYLHSAGITHRDLKCENILLDLNMDIKVCDFGMSKRLTYTDGQLDLSSTFCGTEPYIAPEISRRLPYNPIVADVWSMGVVLFKMLYNALPFQSENFSKMVRLQMRRKINFLDSSDVSRPAEALIQSMLHPDPKHRISLDRVLQSPWMVQGAKVEDAKESPPPEGAEDLDEVRPELLKRKSQEEIINNNE